MDKFDEMVEALEENEDLVECQECFDLFPKIDCIKQSRGYICPACGKLSQTRKIFDTVEPSVFDTYDQEFPDVQDYNPNSTRDYESEPTLGDVLNDLIRDEYEAIDGYEVAEEQIQHARLDSETKDDLLDTLEHIKEEEEEHIDELKDFVEDESEDKDKSEEGIEDADAEVEAEVKAEAETLPLNESDESEDSSKVFIAEDLETGDLVAACWASSESEAIKKLELPFSEKTGKRGSDLEYCYVYEATPEDLELLTKSDFIDDPTSETANFFELGSEAVAESTTALESNSADVLLEAEYKPTKKQKFFNLLFHGPNYQDAIASLKKNKQIEINATVAIEYMKQAFTEFKIVCIGEHKNTAVHNRVFKDFDKALQATKAAAEADKNLNVVLFAMVPEDYKSNALFTPSVINVFQITPNHRETCPIVQYINGKETTAYKFDSFMQKVADAFEKDKELQKLLKDTYLDEVETSKAPTRDDDSEDKKELPRDDEISSDDEEPVEGETEISEPSKEVKKVINQLFVDGFKLVKVNKAKVTVANVKPEWSFSQVLDVAKKFSVQVPDEADDTWVYVFGQALVAETLKNYKLDGPSIIKFIEPKWVRNITTHLSKTSLTFGDFTKANGPVLLATLHNEKYVLNSDFKGELDNLKVVEQNLANLVKLLDNSGDILDLDLEDETEGKKDPEDKDEDKKADDSTLTDAEMEKVGKSLVDLQRLMLDEIQGTRINSLPNPYTEESTNDYHDKLDILVAKVEDLETAEDALEYYKNTFHTELETAKKILVEKDLDKKIDDPEDKDEDSAAKDDSSGTLSFLDSSAHTEIADKLSDLSDSKLAKLFTAVTGQGVTYKDSEQTQVSKNWQTKINKIRAKLKSLGESLEEDEDTVECTWCHDTFDRSECRYEVDLEWLCSRCEAAIKSRGETLTFKENNYWDFLDEDLKDTDAALMGTASSLSNMTSAMKESILNLSPADFAECVDSSRVELWGVEEPEDDGVAQAVLIKSYDEVPSEDIQSCYDEMLDLDGMFTFSFTASGKPSLFGWNAEQLRELNQAGFKGISFDNPAYEEALSLAWRIK